MKVTFEINMKGESAKAEGFIGQVSEHLIDYIKQNNFTVESLKRDIVFDEEEQSAMQIAHTSIDDASTDIAAEPQEDIIEMPMQMAQEKLSKLKEFYGIESKKEQHKVGDIVKHDKLGSGKIVWIQYDKDAAKVDFEKNGSEVVNISKIYS